MNNDFSYLNNLLGSQLLPPSIEETLVASQIDQLHKTVDGNFTNLGPSCVVMALRTLLTNEDTEDLEIPKALPTQRYCSLSIT